MSGYPSVDAQFAKLRFVDMDLADTPDMFKTASEYANRNRWQDVLPNETTLFPPLPPNLKGGSPLKGPYYYPYLNANYFDPQSFYGMPHAFVACQAPLPKQIEDFWYVVGQYRVPFIVMLTQEVEKRATKAHPYWPKKVNHPVAIHAHNPPETHNHHHHGSTSGSSTSSSPTTTTTPHSGETHVAYILTMTREEVEGEIIRRSFEMHAPKVVVNGGRKDIEMGALVHKVEHIQYLGWPDYGVPKDPSTFVSIVDQIQKAPMTSSHYLSATTGKSESATRDQYIHDMVVSGKDVGTGPIITHCSAGIGRAGTLLATYVGHHLQNTLKKQVTADAIFEIVKKLKHTRSGMVQRPEQLAFIYKCLGVKL